MNNYDVLQDSFDIIIDKYNIQRKWKLDYLEMISRSGLCDYRDNKIYISCFLVEFMPIEYSLATLKHEIAHILAGHSDSHGNEWSRWCKVLGISDEPSRYLPYHFYEKTFEYARDIVRCNNCSLVISVLGWDDPNRFDHYHGQLIENSNSACENCKCPLSV